ncbi:hypothetical protein EHI8A_026460 [Entamoeba histolytica HM-1:IMSS-B]|nr:Hypothetical protein EHI5A_044990 [Entamoeba histolytica KU27]EMH74291.1 hypothetical protein EHI8A_026460 [Entamoeba histolytica HM-1:IMSS-B]ENY64310.1 unknown protein, putative [Entamoeba histolytica HM-1:IMSS-A]GAT94648.1 hypothetical protein CL6EHI_006885 [Entamoeba histolytica]
MEDFILSENPKSQSYNESLISLESSSYFSSNTIEKTRENSSDENETSDTSYESEQQPLTPYNLRFFKNFYWFEKVARINEWLEVSPDLFSYPYPYYFPQ